MKLTIYILPSQGHLDMRDTMGFVNDDFFTFVPVDTTELLHVEQQKPYGFIYDNEVMDESLMEALPVFIRHDWDVLVFLKKTKSNGDFKFFESPRIFRPYVELNKLVPSPLWHYERVLDGWILENDRTHS